jgi:hypothetical protein
MPVVTIARQLGSGGEAIAALVGQRLGARVLDAELLTLASHRSGIPVATLAELDERGRSMVRRPLDLFRLVPLPPIDPEQPDVVGDRYPPTGPVAARGQGLLAPAYWAREAYGTLLGRTMQAAAAEGNVIVVGRGGNEALRNLPSTLHVLVVASRGRRVERLMAEEGLTGYQALDRIMESDRDRAGFQRLNYRVDWLDPRRYDLCLSTDRLSDERAAEAIIETARHRVDAEPAPPVPVESAGAGA